MSLDARRVDIAQSGSQRTARCQISSQHFPSTSIPLSFSSLSITPPVTPDPPILEVNKEEAVRCLGIARTHYLANNLPSALRFTRKSIALFSTSEATIFLSKLETAEAKGESSTSATAGGSAGAGGARQRNSSSSANTSNAHASTSASASSSASTPVEKRPHTPAQSALVKRIRGIKVHEYYKILELDKSCADSEVKKAYKKLALQLHPDKNGAPGADEAFKMVSKAFQVLSDGNKRAIYDQTGGDPDSRQQAQASPFSRGGGGGMQGFGGGGGGGMRGEEMSAEELFSFFFGQGGGGGAQFGGGGGGFRTQFYGPGMSARAQQQQQQQQRQQQGAGQPPQSIWLQVAPLLVLVAFSLLTQLPSLFGTSPVPDPDFAFRPAPSYNVELTTFASKVTYFVNSQQFSSHPIYLDTIKLNSNKMKFEPILASGTREAKGALEKHILSGSRTSGWTDGRQDKVGLVAPESLKAFEKKVERSWVHHLQTRCQTELNSRHERMERAKGFFGLGADWDLVRKITAERPTTCLELTKLGYSVSY